jgi:tetratricopeptide (TPR) repeat protein
MKIFSRFRADRRLPTQEKEASIRLYRRCAAQAIADERWPAAEVFFNRIIAIAPGHTEAWLMKGWLRHHCRQDEATALECYQKVIELCAQNRDHPHLQRAKRSLGHILAAAV